jgi:hypothetical protein
MPISYWLRRFSCRCFLYSIRIYFWVGTNGTLSIMGLDDVGVFDSLDRAFIPGPTLLAGRRLQTVV